MGQLGVLCIFATCYLPYGGLFIRVTVPRTGQPTLRIRTMVKGRESPHKREVDTPSRTTVRRAIKPKYLLGPRPGLKTFKLEKEGRPPKPAYGL